jgi:hypothetical protein
MLNISSKNFLALALLYFIFISCNTRTLENSKLINADSLKLAEAIADSVRKGYILKVNQSSPKKVVIISDKSVQVINGPRLSKEIQYQLDSDSYATHYFRKIAERGETLLSFKLKFTSKSKYSGSQQNFFPEINIFKIQNDEFLVNVGTLEWKLYREGDMSFNYLEQIFDYKESEIFICWTTLSTPIKDKFVIAVKGNDSLEFNINNIIGFVNSSKNNKNETTVQ